MIHSSRLLPALVLATSAAAQLGWSQVHPATRPPARSNQGMAYDMLRGVTVLFGGGAFNNLPLGDTWEWNGVNWTQRATAVSPPARYGHAFTFDIARARVVLVGGSTVSNGNDQDDTWEYDGNDWSPVQPANRPSPRRFPSMEYDVARGRTVLFGGYSGSNETWEWNGVNWTQRSPATSPGPRWAHGMTYDFVRAKIVLFGGIATAPIDDTWTWDGTNWSQVQVTAPTSGTGIGFASNGTRDVVVLFSATSTYSYTWLFDQVTWRQDPRFPRPPPRVGCSSAHDVVRGRTVLFGGFDPVFPYAPLDDTWEYDPGTIARSTAYGSGCPGTAGVPALQIFSVWLPIIGRLFVLELSGVPSNAAWISWGWSDQQWGTNTLPWDLGAIGMTGCTLHASPDFLWFAPVTAGRAYLTRALPNHPSLIGIHFFNQGLVLDLGINPLGATTSNAVANVIGGV